MKITVYHNPRCSKSRQSLDILNTKNIDYDIIEYLKTPLKKNDLLELFKKLNINPAQAIRKNESEFKDNNIKQFLDDSDKMLDMIIKHPKILERPIVVNKDRAVIARPPEKLLEIL